MRSKRTVAVIMITTTIIVLGGLLGVLCGATSAEAVATQEKLIGNWKAAFRFVDGMSPARVHLVEILTFRQGGVGEFREYRTYEPMFSGRAQRPNRRVRNFEWTFRRGHVRIRGEGKTAFNLSKLIRLSQAEMVLESDDDKHDRYKRLTDAEVSQFDAAWMKQHGRK